MTGPTPQPPQTPDPNIDRTSSGVFATPTHLEARHRRTVTGIVLMIIGVLFAVPVLVDQILDALHPPATAVPAFTFMEFVHEFGFPLLLIAGGYNLFSKEAFSDIVDKVKSVLPGNKTPGV